ncbi:MAG TPA: hypothetical protein VEP90_25850, partial [Methylomirabilota bacterium]|nr:hypothetical protein [Methylomirabilota bacterium]
YDLAATDALVRQVDACLPSSDKLSFRKRQTFLQSVSGRAKLMYQKRKTQVQSAHFEAYVGPCLPLYG